MAFSMNDIKRKKSNQQNDIKFSCYYITHNDILTENVKLAMLKYCEFRFKSRNRGKFGVDEVKQMVQELLEKIIRQPYNSIGIKQVKFNEMEIIFQIKQAIKHGATYNIYFEGWDYIDSDKLDKADYNFIKNKHSLKKEEVEDYLKDLVI